MANRKAAAEASPDSVAELQAAVTELRSEIRTLYLVMDEFREDFTHCLRNLPDNLPPPYAHLGTMFEAFSNDSRAPQSDVTEVASEPKVKPQPVVENTAPVEATPKLPSPVAAALPKTSSPPVPAIKRSALLRKSKQPLRVRMVFVPLMTEVVRIAGYDRWETGDLKQRLRPLCVKYGQETVEQAAQELLSCDDDSRWRLSDEALQHASQILGSRQAMKKSPDPSPPS